jgi:hypothetical protein
VLTRFLLEIAAPFLGPRRIVALVSSLAFVWLYGASLLSLVVAAALIWFVESEVQLDTAIGEALAMSTVFSYVAGGALFFATHLLPSAPPAEFAAVAPGVQLRLKDSLNWPFKIAKQFECGASPATLRSAIDICAENQRKANPVRFPFPKMSYPLDLRVPDLNLSSLNVPPVAPTWAQKLQSLVKPLATGAITVNHNPSPTSTEYGDVAFLHRTASGDFRVRVRTFLSEAYAMQFVRNRAELQVAEGGNIIVLPSNAGDFFLFDHSRGGLCTIRVFGSPYVVEVLPVDPRHAEIGPDTPKNDPLRSTAREVADNLAEAVALDVPPPTKLR